MTFNFVSVRRTAAFVTVALLSLLTGALVPPTPASAAGLGTITWNGAAFDINTLTSADQNDPFDVTVPVGPMLYIENGTATVSSNGTPCSGFKPDCRLPFPLTKTFTITSTGGGTVFLHDSDGNGRGLLATITLVPSGGAGGAGEKYGCAAGATEAATGAGAETNGYGAGEATGAAMKAGACVAAGKTGGGAGAKNCVGSYRAKSSTNS